MFGFRVGNVGTLEQAKASFFDRKRVTDAADRGTQRVLSKFGAYCRQRARTSIRKRRGVSDPGSPPSSHVGLLREGVLFAYDAQARSVVIGPVKINKPGQAPQLLEGGGEATIPARGQHKARRAFYRPRPFMRPAFDAELGTLGPNWRDSIR